MTPDTFSVLTAEQATSLHWLNGPSGDPFNAAIGSLGGTHEWRQHERLLAL